MRSLVLGSALLAATFIAPPILANGKFPAADQLIVDPSEPAHLVLRTTYGILISRNSGKDWDWVCETGALYDSYEPGLAVTGDGSIIAGLLDGVAHASADACGWSISFAGSVPDVSVTRSDPSVAVAITVDPATLITRYLESQDNGASFTQVGVDVPAKFLGVTVDVAPTDPSRIYVSGVQFDGDSGQGSLARSSDHGASWTLSPIPTSDAKKAPYIGAMDPNDPDRLYVRLDNAPGIVHVTKDGGDTWTAHEVGSTMASIRGLAVSPDGATILAGGEFEGLWRASTDTFEFEQLSSLAVRCLTWTDAGVYACVNEFLYCDGFIVGLSRDAGSSFEPLLKMGGTRGPLECAPESTVGAACPELWPALSEKLAKELCGTGGGSSTGGGAATGGGGAEPNPAVPAGSNSCGCSLDEGESSPALAVISACLLLAATRRRRRIGAAP